jgi:prepilin-type N-terminal cleavage/methylation domain-containing protein
MKSYEHKAGVTLVEMLIVLAIIVLLISITIGVATSVQNKGKEQLIKNTFGLLEGALQEYRDYMGSFPEAMDADPNLNCEILYRELERVPGSRQIMQEITDSLIDDKAGTPGLEIYDPWSTVLDYRYDRAVDTFPVLTSAGPDGRFETTDDINSD